MSRMSRGCRRCRERRVRCDGGRPACQHCVRRDDVCEGYRDEASLIFRHETRKTIDSNNNTSRTRISSSAAGSILSSSLSSFSPSSRASSTPNWSSETESRPRSRSVDRRDHSSRSSSAAVEMYMPRSQPWLKKKKTTAASTSSRSIEDESIIDRFMDKYVLYPCNESSTPGFLEHLPCMFKEVNVEGRLALRYAVQAAALADMSSTTNENDNDNDDAEIGRKALECYGMSLSALGQSLQAAQPGKVPDDYDLMTVVMLDIFETFHIQDESTNRMQMQMHAQGMAQILRLRGKDQVYSPRGWSLFRLAHHRVQKQQLAFHLKLVSPRQSKEWIDQLDEDIPFVHLEKNAAEIKDVCERARALQESLLHKSHTGTGNVEEDVTAALAVINEILEVDRQVVSWRANNPRWAYKTVPVSELEITNNNNNNNFAAASYPSSSRSTNEADPGHDHPASNNSAAAAAAVVRSLTDVVELHVDLWMIYEWNYHRTARMIVHEQLVRCIDALLSTSPSFSFVSSTTTDTTLLLLHNIHRASVSTIRSLAEQILATVPQSLGDVNRLGRVHDYYDGGGAPPRCRAIGGYLLLWSIRVVAGAQTLTTADQKRRAKLVFERIREYTGMKARLGSTSSIL